MLTFILLSATLGAAWYFRSKKNISFAYPKYLTIKSSVNEICTVKRERWERLQVLFAFNDELDITEWLQDHMQDTVEFSFLVHPISGIPCRGRCGPVEIMVELQERENQD